MNATPDLSVVIPTYHRADTLDRCLAHLARQTVDTGRFEVIVADDASPDDTAAVVERWAASTSLNLHYRRCAKGFAGAARNRGVEMASGGRILFLGDDVLAAPDLVEQHLAGATRYGADAVLVGEVQLGPAPLAPFMRYLEEEGVHHDFVRLRASGGAPVSGWYFYACNASVSRHAFDRAGGFDESILHAFEDGELGCRLAAAGFPLHFLPEARGLHVHPMDVARYVGFLRAGRADVAHVVELAVERGEPAPDLGHHPALDRVVTDGAVDTIARLLARTDRFLGDAIRRPLYRALVRYERRRAFQAAGVTARIPFAATIPEGGS